MMRSLSLSDGVAGAEGARRATGDPATGADGSVPDPAVSEKARRRRFTTEYKLPYDPFLGTILCL